MMFCPYCCSENTEAEGSTLECIPEWTCKACGASFWAEPGNAREEDVVYREEVPSVHS